MSDRDLHLASSSARRREILAALGLRFSWRGTDVDESTLPGEEAAGLVLRLAAAKARAAAAAGRRGLPVLAADTAVVLDGRIFGKPATKEEAIEMLRALSGRTHEVLTGVACKLAGELSSALSVSRVTFRDITPAEAAAYWHTGEPCDKAGAYAIQGLGGLFVRALAGSYSGVMGLPVYETGALLREAGIELLPAEGGRNP